MKRAGIVLIMILAFCGVADSAYVAQHEAAGTPLLCNIQSLSGCNIVSASPYSHVFGISLAEYGILYYGALFVLAALELAVVDQLLRRVLQGLTLFGIIVSIYSVILQVFVIRALCVYCLGSALIILLMCILSTLIEPMRLRSSASKKEDTPPLPPNAPLPMPPVT